VPASLVNPVPTPYMASHVRLGEALRVLEQAITTRSSYISKRLSTYLFNKHHAYLF
jgi:hypothetical protein